MDARAAFWARRAARHLWTVLKETPRRTACRIHGHRWKAVRHEGHFGIELKVVCQRCENDGYRGKKYPKGWREFRRNDPTAKKIGKEMWAEALKRFEYRIPVNLDVRPKKCDCLSQIIRDEHRRLPRQYRSGAE